MSAPAPTVGKPRTVTTVEDVPPIGSPLRCVVLFALLVVAVGFAAGAALAYSARVYVVSVVAVCVLEIAVDRFAPFIAWGLNRVGAGSVPRAMVMGATLVVFAVQTNGPAMVIATMTAVLIALAAAMARSAATQAIDYLRRPPVMTRGLDLGVPPAPPALPSLILRQHGAERLPDVAAAIGLALAAFKRGPDGYGYAGLAIYLAASLIIPFVVVSHTWRVRRLRLRQRVSRAAAAKLAELDPRVVLYFGEGPAWQYQVEVWLEAIEATGHVVPIVVRDRDLLHTLPRTNLPIVCVPASRELMQLHLPSLRGALFVGNNSNNLHMLRRPGVTTVFLGHGDSDKDASRNPFTRAYEQIWVAGPAGRERYRVAGVGVSEHAFREIGRPQLAELGRRRLPGDDRVTVLYAPTWEGWGESPNHSSLALVGVELVRALLARPGVRVMYRPHPRTGHIRGEMMRAHRQVVELLTAAGAVEPPPATVDPALATGDALDVCLRVRPADLTPGERASRDDRFWSAHPGHVVLTGDAPDLYASFRAADVLIADISSVVTDFLAADRPYAIVNNTDRDEHEFRDAVPTAAGGFVLGRDLSGLDDVLQAAADPRRDPTGNARVRARRYLLGPSGAEAQQRFRDELDRLAGTDGSGGDLRRPGVAPAAAGT